MAQDRSIVLITHEGGLYECVIAGPGAGLVVQWISGPWLDARVDEDAAEIGFKRNFGQRPERVEFMFLRVQAWPARTEQIAVYLEV